MMKKYLDELNLDSENQIEVWKLELEQSTLTKIILCVLRFANNQVI